MNIKLNSDFHDFYDHWFASPNQKTDFVLDRNTTDGLTRPNMFKTMRSMGLTTPMHGKVRDLYAELIERTPFQNLSEKKRFAEELFQVVVYTDISAHCGDGKLLLGLEEAKNHYPEHFASEYIPALPNGFGQTLRYMRIGKRQFWLRYTSTDDWRSNCGNVHIEVLCEETAKSREELQKAPFNRPIFAVDFVSANDLYAIDLNVSPGLKGTGIEEFISAKEVYSEIQDWFSACNKYL